jgi:hypothetical protein
MNKSSSRIYLWIVPALMAVVLQGCYGFSQYKIKNKDSVRKGTATVTIYGSDIAVQVCSKGSGGWVDTGKSFQVPANEPVYIYTEGAIPYSSPRKICRNAVFFRFPANSEYVLRHSRIYEKRSLLQKIFLSQKVRCVIEVAQKPGGEFTQAPYPKGNHCFDVMDDELTPANAAQAVPIEQLFPDQNTAGSSN